MLASSKDDMTCKFSTVVCKPAVSLVWQIELFPDLINLAYTR